MWYYYVAENGFSPSEAEILDEPDAGEDATSNGDKKMVLVSLGTSLFSTVESKAPQRVLQLVAYCAF